MAASILSALERQLQVRDLLCPLLLQLACDSTPDTSPSFNGQEGPWSRSAEIIDRFLLSEVSRWGQRKKASREAQGLFLMIAGELALQLWQTEPRRSLWSVSEVATEIERIRGRFEFTKFQADLITDLCDIGILTLVGDDSAMSPLAFRHRSVGAFMAGSALARRMKRGERPSGSGQLLGRLLGPQKPDEVLNFISDKSYDPAWEDVILGCAACIDTPTSAGRLISLLSDQDSDDILRGRSSLAALCLCEMMPDIRRALTPETTALATRCYDLLKAHIDKYAENGLPRTRRALRQFSEIDALVHGEPLSTVLLRALNGDELTDRLSALTMLAHVVPHPRLASCRETLIQEVLHPRRIDILHLRAAQVRVRVPAFVGSIIASVSTACSKRLSSCAAPSALSCWRAAHHADFASDRSFRSVGSSAKRPQKANSNSRSACSRSSPTSRT